MHDATKVLMGSTQSSYREGASSYQVSDVTDFPAGTVVRLNSSGSLSVTKSDGSYLGISLGVDLSDAGKIVVLKAGLRVPVLLTDQDPPDGDYDYVEMGKPLWVDDVTGLSNIVDDGGVTTTVSAAIYVTGALTGINEDGDEVAVALVDMPGGL